MKLLKPELPPDPHKEMLTRLMFVAQLLQRADNQRRKRLQVLKIEDQKSHKP